MIEYSFARKATYAFEAAYAHKVRILRVSDLSLRVCPSDLGSCDDLILSENSYGFVTRAICDHASEFIFLNFWPVTVRAIWSDLIGLYGFVVCKE